MSSNPPHASLLSFVTPHFHECSLYVPHNSYYIPTTTVTSELEQDPPTSTQHDSWSTPESLLYINFALPVRVLCGEECACHACLLPVPVKPSCTSFLCGAFLLLLLILYIEWPQRELFLPGNNTLTEVWLTEDICTHLQRRKVFQYVSNGTHLFFLPLCVCVCILICICLCAYLYASQHSP